MAAPGRPATAASASADLVAPHPGEPRADPRPPALAPVPTPLLEAGGLQVDYHESDAGHHIDPAHVPAAQQLVADVL